MTRAKSTISGFATALLGTFAAANASAHNFASHDAITRAATSAMHFWPKDGTTANFCPNPGELPWTDEFIAYRNKATQALGQLRNLRTGLKPLTSPTNDCMQLIAADGTVARPGYFPQDNLDKIGQFRIADFHYLVTADSTTGCGMTPIQGALANEDWRTLGSVLGNLAGEVDKRNTDTTLWAKPTNMAEFEVMKDIISVCIEAELAYYLAPIGCLLSLLSGDSCGDIGRFIHQFNPLEEVAGMIPGVTCNFTGADFGLDVNGLWHFQETNGKQNNYFESYNVPPGIDYVNAGPYSIPGAIDVAIIAATTAAGITLNAWVSTGVRDFGQFDEADRDVLQWQAHPIGLTEFTPVGKLAKYGRKAYDSSQHTTAEALGYPLHAFADATFPQHLANTTGWGHRPMEDAINNLRADILKFDGASDIKDQDRFIDCHRPVEIVQEGFKYWQQYNMYLGGHVDVDDLVHSLASRSRAWIDSRQNVWSDSASDQYLLTPDPHTNSVASYRNENYGNNMTLTEFSTPLEVSAAGASVAFLVDAGLMAADVPKDPSTICPNGTYYEQGHGCQPLLSMPPMKVLQASGGVSIAGKATPAQTCTAVGQACTSSAECCDRDCYAGVCRVILQ